MTTSATPSDSRPVVLDFATDATLDASLAGLEPGYWARLIDRVTERAVAESDRTLVDAVRVDLAEEAPDRTAIGVVFGMASEDSDGCCLGGEGMALFDDRGTDYFTFDDVVQEVFAERWPNVGRSAAVVVDLRGEASVWFAHTDRDIYSIFNIAPPVH